MKKSLKFLFAAILSVSFFAFLSCQDVIFDEIRNEVKLDDANVQGSIGSVVRYKDDIYVATGIIWHQSKEETSAKWVKLDGIPGGIIYQIAADSENIYACSLTFKDDDDGHNDPDQRTLYKYDGSAWTALFSVGYSSSNAFFVFCTNTPKEANRKAFFRYGSNVYELSSSVAETTDIKSWSALTDSSYTIARSSVLSQSLSSGETLISNVRSATYLNGVILSTCSASTSNETEDKDATYAYTASGDDIYYSTDGTDWKDVGTDSHDILSIGFSQNFMLLGTSEGIQHVAITDNVPEKATQGFDNNAASALSSYYEVPALLVVDPSQSEYNTPIFASVEFDGSSSSTSATLDNVGLWGYYQGKGEWNRQ